MSDLIAKLNTLEETSVIEFCKTNKDAKLPKVCRKRASLFLLFALEDYNIKTWSFEDAKLQIDTGIAIKFSKNVEVTVFAPVFQQFDSTFTEKQSELVWNPLYDRKLVFIAEQLFRAEFFDPREHTIVIHKGGPLCYIQVESSPQVWAEGIDV